MRNCIVRLLVLNGPSRFFKLITDNQYIRLFTPSNSKYIHSICVFVVFYKLNIYIHIRVRVYLVRWWWRVKTQYIYKRSDDQTHSVWDFLALYKRLSNEWSNITIFSVWMNSHHFNGADKNVMPIDNTHCITPLTKHKDDDGHLNYAYKQNWI